MFGFFVVSIYLEFTYNINMIAIPWSLEEDKILINNYGKIYVNEFSKFLSNKTEGTNILHSVRGNLAFKNNDFLVLV